MATLAPGVKARRSAVLQSPHMKAMLLAAGAGTRLRPLTDRVPKPLAPIANQPLLARTLQWLAWEGVGEVVINLHHHAEQIRSAVADGSAFGVSVAYSVEEELLGTAGAVKRAAHHFGGEPFFVVYGDNLIDADLRRLAAVHDSTGADATLALFEPDDASSCGMVDRNQDGRIVGFYEKPAQGAYPESASLANAAVYVIAPTLLDALPDGVSDFGADVFPAWLADGRRLIGEPLGGYLQDTGSPARYRRANRDVLAGGLRHNAVGRRLGSSVIDDSEGDSVSGLAHVRERNIIGAGCRVGARSVLRDCIVWPGASIGADCRLVNVIVGQGARVGDGVVATDTVLV